MFVLVLKKVVSSIPILEVYMNKYGCSSSLMFFIIICFIVCIANQGNAAEINVRELKRASARKMMSTNSPKKLWDHSLELEAIVRSHTAHDHFGLDGEVPETLMTGRPGDISHICEYSWYQWVMYLNPTGSIRILSGN